MNNMRISPLILVLISIVVVGIIGFGIFFFVSNKPTTNTATNPPVFPATTGTNNTSTVTVPTDSGIVEVKDVRTYPDTTAIGGDNYVVGGTATSSASASYQILYFQSDFSYLISLLREPLGDVRRAAETELLQKLGITKTEACKLSISVGTPVSVNETLGGRELGLSFCPGAVIF